MLFWRSLGSAIVLAALAVGGMTTACGAPTPLEAAEAAPTDPWVVSASKSTRSALGVHSWGFRTMAGGTLAVRGYDEEHQRVVEIRQRIVETDATHWVLDLAVARSSGTSGVRFLLGARATADGLEVVGDVAADTLGPNAAARRVLDYLRADARLPGAMDPASIKPLDLVGGGGGSVVGDKEGPITDEKDGGLTGEGSEKDEKCQESSQCGGDMMSSLGPVLGMLGSAGSGLSSFAGIFQCVGAAKADAGDAGGNATTPEGLYDLAKCAIEQAGQQQQQQAGQAGQGQGGQGGGGLETLTQALSAFTSMQQMGQNCNCPQ